MRSADQAEAAERLNILRKRHWIQGSFEYYGRLG